MPSQLFLILDPPELVPVVHTAGTLLIPGTWQSWWQWWWQWWLRGLGRPVRICVLRVSFFSGRSLVKPSRRFTDAIRARGTQHEELSVFAQQGS